ncbi:MAG: glycosyltransferase family 2 protein [Syntrophotaleaceae bacterium]
MLFSIVIPVKDECAQIFLLADEIDLAMKGVAWTWEVVWVDDGSTDGSLKELERLNAARPQHRYISFEVNAGQSAALHAGFGYAQGAIIAMLDGDGQNDPADLVPMVGMVEDGRADMVNGYREKRQDSLVRLVASRIANFARNSMTGRTVRDVGCSTRVFRRECVEDLPTFKGMHRFLPSLVAIKGYSLAEIPVNHRPRLFGQTKYSINNRLWVGLADLFGVLWFRKRHIHYQVAKKA